MNPQLERKDAIRASFDDEAVDEVFRALSRPRAAIADRDESLDWLAGRQAHGYYVDMLFAQQYARWNRERMSDAVCAALDIEPTDRFQSIHNYIDFRDLTIRKGATLTPDGQRLVIPFNMAEGSLLARGNGNSQYHRTAPHGAGRTMSRREAHDSLTVEAFERAMTDVYSESVGAAGLDEAPRAYKPVESILNAIKPTAEVHRST